MPEESGLEALRVKDVLNHVEVEPDVIHCDISPEELLRKMIANPHTRHVYVVDNAGRLCGAVRMNMVVEYLFPFTSLRAGSSEWLLKTLPSFDDKTLCDLMNDQPCSVTEDTPLAEMAEILMRERINELPVVDENRRIVGQVNVYNVIATHLREKERARRG